jgi:hypothetical protein
MKSWIEENPVTYRKQIISNQIRKLKRSSDPHKDHKITLLEEEYAILHAPMLAKKKEGLNKFLERF